jgi:hypothetical protein
MVAVRWLASIANKSSEWGGTKSTKGTKGTKSTKSTKDKQGQ